MSGFSLSALKNTLDEVRVQVYPKNETEKKVGIELFCNYEYSIGRKLMCPIYFHLCRYMKPFLLSRITAHPPHR